MSLWWRRETTLWPGHPDKLVNKLYLLHNHIIRPISIIINASNKIIELLERLLYGNKNIFPHNIQIYLLRKQQTICHCDILYIRCMVSHYNQSCPLVRYYLQQILTYQCNTLKDSILQSLFINGW